MLLIIKFHTDFPHIHLYIDKFSFLPKLFLFLYTFCNIILHCCDSKIWFYLFKYLIKRLKMLAIVKINQHLLIIEC